MCDISRATPNVHDVFILIKQANCVQQLLWRHLLINHIMYIKKNTRFKLYESFQS